jgi:hypothetical protein
VENPFYSPSEMRFSLSATLRAKRKSDRPHQPFNDMKIKSRRSRGGKREPTNFQKLNFIFFLLCIFFIVVFHFFCFSLLYSFHFLFFFFLFKEKKQNNKTKTQEIQLGPKLQHFLPL